MFNLDNMPLSRKISLVMSLFVLLSAGLTGYALDRISILTANTDELVNQHGRQTLLLKQMQEEIGRTFLLSYEGLVEENPVKIAGIRKEIAETVSAYEADFSELAQIPGEEAQAIPEFRRLAASLREDMNRAMALAHAGNPAAGEEVLQTVARADFDKLDGAIKTLVEGNARDMAAAKAGATELATRSFWSMLIATIVGVVFTLFLVLTLVRRKIAGPIGEITATMTALANDRIIDQVRYADRQDEIGSMAKAVLVFRDAATAKLAAENARRRIEEEQKLVVDQLGDGLSRLSDGDLMTTLRGFPQGYAKLEADFNRALDQLRNALTSIHESSGSIHTGASEVDAASTDLSRRTEHQAASLQETAAAVNQINAALRQTAESASAANSAVNHARQDAEQSGTVVRQTIEAMRAIERDSDEISQIITVIDGIAFQTNLLALNAGVEAARAGEAGRGFAVVASEVRALAQRAADAAKDVKERITTSAGNVATGAKLVAETGSALERIAVRVNETSELVSRITSAAQEQSGGLEQVSSAVSELDGVTQRNAAMVEEAAAASRSLAGEAEALVQQVSRFNIGRSADEGRRFARKPSAPPALPVRAPSRPVSAPVPASRGNLALAVDTDEDWTEF